MKSKLYIFIFLAATVIRCFGQTAGDYRSVNSGNWATLSTWETYNGTAWVAPATVPNNTSGVITIQSPNTVTIAATVNIDQVIVDVGAILINSVGTLTISNGAGVDLTVNGTFIDANNTAMGGWATAGPTWELGANGTFIKRSSASSNNWRDRYNGGIINIPATANWIVEKFSATNPAITTVGGMYYPNLTIINNTVGNWITSAAANTFNGTTDYPRIKGDFNIGSASAIGTVDFLANVTFATPISVGGDMNIYTGNRLRNFGTGFNLQGNLIVNGTLDYAGGGGNRGITFSGGNNQNISGSGALNIYNLTINKSSGTVTLNRSITIDNLLTLISGIVNSSSSNLLSINTFATVSGANNSGFVSGPVRYTGYNSFIYPIGKNSDYQALEVSGVTPYPIFWTEAFSNGCASNCAATSYTGPNGAWTVASTGTNDADNNRWYISGAECGNAAGGCGSVCGAADPSLHIGSNATVLGDNGAAYLAGGLGFWFVRTDLRAESPVINCTGKSNITLSFNYIENGQGTTDNATLWYFDGSAWSQLVDLPKTVLCGAQGTWTNYSITLPASADNNPNVKIGFRWVNNDDNVGTDPSFAVDDIQLNTPIPIVDFTAEYFYNDPQTTFNNILDPSLDHISNCEYWTLTRNAGTENKYVTLTWDANSCGITALPDLRVAHWNGSVWQNEGKIATTGNTSAGTITSNLVTWFSPFTISSVVPIVLPIELLSFTGKNNNSENNLFWQTATETNNDFFTLEHSLDGIHFSEIGIINGAGNSNSILNYSFIHKTPTIGINYYRLKQTDFNGSFKYSNIISLEVKKHSFFQIVNAYHSAESDILEITFNCSGDCFIAVELYDALGKKITSENIHQEGENIRVRFSLNSLSKGVYFIKANNGKEIISQKILF